MKIKWMVCCTLPVVFILPLGVQAGIKQVSPGAYTPPAYEALRLGNVKTMGWRKRQLQIMRIGSSGHLDEYYGKIKNDNGWPGSGSQKIPSWQIMNGVAYRPPTDREGRYKGKVDTVLHNTILVPYGFTKVRVVAFPVVS